MPRETSFYVMYNKLMTNENSTSAVNEFCKNSTDWSFVENSLKADFCFADYTVAIEVINRVAEAAERLNHHPTLINTYNKISFILRTHDVGDLVTSKDVELAKEISVIVEDLKR